MSLVAHGEKLNGRYAAHFFAHLFLMLPGWVFDIVNSLVFVLQVFIVTQIATYKKERSNLLSLFLFGISAAVSSGVTHRKWNLTVSALPVVV